METEPDDPIPPISDILTKIQVEDKLNGIQFDTSVIPNLSKYEIDRNGGYNLINGYKDAGSKLDYDFAVGVLNAFVDYNGVNLGRCIVIQGKYIVYSENEIVDINGKRIPKGWNFDLLDENGIAYFYGKDRYITVTEIIDGDLWNGVWGGSSLYEEQTNGTKLNNIILNQYQATDSNNIRYAVIDNPVLYSNGEQVGYTDDITVNFEVKYRNTNGTFSENPTINIMKHHDIDISDNEHIYITYGDYIEHIEFWFLFNCSGLNINTEEYIYDENKTCVVLISKDSTITILEAKLIQANKMYVEPVEPIDIYLDQPITVQANGSQNFEAMAKVRFTPTETATYSLTSNSQYDTYGYLYDSNGNLIASDDDSGNESNFKITQELNAGETYIYAVRFYDEGDTGEMELLLTKSVAEVDLTAFEVGQYIKGIKFDIHQKPDLSQFDDFTEWEKFEGNLILVNGNTFTQNYIHNLITIFNFDLLKNENPEFANKKGITVDGKMVYSEANGVVENVNEYGWNIELLDDNDEYNLEELYVINEIYGGGNNWNGSFVGADVYESQGTILQNIELYEYINNTRSYVVNLPLKDKDGVLLEGKSCEVFITVNNTSYIERLIFDYIYSNDEWVPVWKCEFKTMDGKNISLSIIANCSGINGNGELIHDITKAYLSCSFEDLIISYFMIDVVIQRHLTKITSGETLIGITFDKTYTRDDIIALFEKMYGKSSFTESGEIHDLITTTDGYRLYVSTVKQNGSNEVRIINELNGVDDVHNTIIYTSSDFIDLQAGWYNISEDGHIALNGVTIGALHYESYWNGLFIGKE